MDSLNKCKCGKPADRKILFEPEVGFIYLCSDACKENIVQEMEKNRKKLLEIDENVEYRQGKSRENYEASAKIVVISGVILLIGFVISLISYILTTITNT
jgi:hypothetical protein